MERQLKNSNQITPAGFNLGKSVIQSDPVENSDSSAVKKKFEFTSKKKQTQPQPPLQIKGSFGSGVRRRVAKVQNKTAEEATEDHLISQPGLEEQDSTNNKRHKTVENQENDDSLEIIETMPIQDEDQIKERFDAFMETELNVDKDWDEPKTDFVIPKGKFQAAMSLSDDGKKNYKDNALSKQSSMSMELLNSAPDRSNFDKRHKNRGLIDDSIARAADNHNDPDTVLAVRSSNSIAGDLTQNIANMSTTCRTENAIEIQFCSEANQEHDDEFEISLDAGTNLDSCSPIDPEQPEHNTEATAADKPDIKAKKRKRRKRLSSSNSSNHSQPEESSVSKIMKKGLKFSQKSGTELSQMMALPNDR